MVELMKIMVTSFKRSHVCTATLSAPDPAAAGHCQHTSPPETPGHSQENLGQSLVGSLLLSPGSWCTQGFVCALQESVSLVLCKFCNQSPLACKIKFPGGSHSLCWIPRLGNLLCTLELSEQCENFSIIVCLVALWWGLHTTPPRSAAARAPVPMAGHC